MEKTTEIIIDFIYDWRSRYGIDEDVRLTDDQTITFINELHAEIAQMVSV